MKQNKFYKILCFCFVIVILVSSMPLSAVAATTIDASGVYSDLKNMKVDLSLYKKNTEDANAKIISFLEYAYDANGKHGDYGLYLYVYNPTCEKIEKNSAFNTIQLSIETISGNVSAYKKYKLIFISNSTESDGEGLGYLYYKFKIDLPSSFVNTVAKVKRIYKVVDLELQYPDEYNPRMSKISNEYIYTGYQAYHGVNSSSDHSTLYCVSNNLESVSIDLHPATWKTISSDKGENYQYEVSSVYFSIPDYYLEKYGNMADEEFKGLYSVSGEWYEYKINGFVTNNFNLYSDAKAFIGVKPEYDSFYYRYSGLLGNNIKVKYDKDVPFGFVVVNGSKTSPYYDCYNALYSNFANSQSINMLHNAFCYETNVFKKISTEELLEGIYAPGVDNVWHYGYVDDGRTIGYNAYTIKVDDADLNSQIAAFSTEDNTIRRWLKGYGKLSEDAGGYEAIRPIVMIEDEHFEGFTTSKEAKAEDLFITEGDYIKLKSFYDGSVSDEKTTYLMRFAVTDYFCAEAYVTDNGESELTGNSYYFEKTIFHNFDVLEFTFRDEESKYTTVPVSSKLISIVGEITPPAGDNGSLGDKVKDVIDIWGNLAAWLKVIIFVAGAVLVIFLFVKFGRFFIDRLDKRFERRMRRQDMKLRRQEAALKAEENRRKDNEDRRRDDKNNRDWNEDRRRDDKNNRDWNEDRRRDDKNNRDWNEDRRRDDKNDRELYKLELDSREDHRRDRRDRREQEKHDWQKEDRNKRKEK